jgi:predicted transposase YdaD
LRLLASWKVSIEVKEILDAQDREELMALSQVFLDWEQKTIGQAQKQEAESLVLRQLTRRLGQVMPETETEIRALSLPQLEDLGEALLDFSQPSDLDLWLRSQSVSAGESQS